MEKNNYLRQVAVKTTINLLLSGTYMQEDEQSPNFLLTIYDQKIYRLNLVATILNKEQQGIITNFLIDDGTGTIILRFFEENKKVTTLGIGDIVLIIGKLRRYNQEKYLSPEVIKKVPPLWLKERKLELELSFSEMEKENRRAIVEDIKEEIIESTETTFPELKVVQLIKELDKGEGVLIEEIIGKSPLPGTEQIIEKMLRGGDIFQITPGKIKVL